MAFCENCGEKIEEGAKFCGGCGALLNNKNIQEEPQHTEKFRAQMQDFVKQAGGTDCEMLSYTEEEVQSGKLMGILAYLGILVLIPFLAEKNNRFVRFHVNQGLVLLAASALNMVAGMVLPVFGNISFVLMMLLGMILGIISLLIGIFAIIGIVNVIKGKAKQIPVFGGIQILK